MDVGLAKFFLDVFKEIRSLVVSNKTTKSDVALGSFLKLYGSGKRLVALASQFLQNVDKGSVEITDKECDKLIILIKEIHAFGQLFRELNLFAIDIFRPGLGDALDKVVGADTDLLASFKYDIVPEFSLDNRDIPKIVSSYVENFHVYSPGGLRWELEESGPLATFWLKQQDPWANMEDLPKADIVSAVETAVPVFKELTEAVATTIREHWEFSDLLKVDEL